MFLFRRRRAARIAAALAEFAECESVHATEISALHLRRLRDSAFPTLLPTGGLALHGIVAACGAEVAWDRRGVSCSAIIDALPNQHPSFHYCEDCLDFTGIQLQH